MLPLLAGGLIAGGLIGSLTSKTPKYNMGALNNAAALIEKQYGNINEYFTQANTAFEGQYKNLYGTTMQDTVNQMAGSGVYESPVSQNALNRTQMALGEQYATGKSTLAGQKMQAMGSVDQAKIGYLQNLANIQYQQAQAKAAKKSSIFGAIGGIGGALIGA